MLLTEILIRKINNSDRNCLVTLTLYPKSFFLILTSRRKLRSSQPLTEAEQKRVENVAQTRVMVMWTFSGVTKIADRKSLSPLHTTVGDGGSNQSGFTMD